MSVRLLQITSYPPPRAGWGVRVEYLRRHLEAEGHVCDVLNMGANRRVKSPEYVDVQGGLDYVRKVWRFSRRGYLVHAHLNGDSPKGLLLTLLAQALALVNRRRPVVTFHAGPMQKYFPQERSWLFAPGYWLVFLLARGIICNSEVVKTRIVGYGVSPGRIHCIPAFSRQYLDFTPVELDGALEAFMAAHAPLLCSYVFFRPEFQIPTLIDAMARVVATHSGTGLIIMGSDAGADSTRQQIHHLGLDGHVMLTGDLPHDAFLAVMTRTRMYIRTPPKDGVCSSVLEALALGIPVVASDNGTRPRSVVTYTPGDAAHLSERIIEVLSRGDAARAGIARPEIRDTVADEAALLVGWAAGRGGHA